MEKRDPGRGEGGQKGIWGGTEIEKINVIKMKDTSCSACLKYRYIEQYCWLYLERASYVMFHQYLSQQGQVFLFLSALWLLKDLPSPIICEHISVYKYSIKLSEDKK